MSEIPGGFIQPNLEVPPRNDPLYWANIPRTRTAWYRAAGDQLGLDANKLITGFVLDLILRDDINSYALVHDPIIPGNPELSRSLAIARLDCELETPELPDSIMEKLQGFQSYIADKDWVNEEQFTEVRVARETLVADVNNLIVTDEDLKEAVKYYHAPQIKQQWEPHWRNFMAMHESKG